MPELREVQVPDIGDFDQVAVTEVLVKPGDQIEVESPLITLESDKATMDVPSPWAGTVKEVKVAAGAKVGKGAAILTLEVEEAAEKPAPAPPAPAPEKGRPAAPAPEKAPPPAAPTPERPPPTPERPPRGAARSDRRVLLRQGLRRARGAPLRARAGGRPGTGARQRARGAHPARGRAGLRQVRSRRRRRRRRRPRPPGDAARSTSRSSARSRSGRSGASSG